MPPPSLLDNLSESELRVKAFKIQRSHSRGSVMARNILDNLYSKDKPEEMTAPPSWTLVNDLLADALTVDHKARKAFAFSECFHNFNMMPQREKVAQASLWNGGAKGCTQASNPFPTRQELRSAANGPMVGESPTLNIQPIFAQRLADNATGVYQRAAAQQQVPRQLRRSWAGTGAGSITADEIPPDPIAAVGSLRRVSLPYGNVATQALRPLSATSTCVILSPTPPKSLRSPGSTEIQAVPVSKTRVVSRSPAPAVAPCRRVSEGGAQEGQGESPLTHRGDQKVARFSTPNRSSVPTTPTLSRASSPLPQATSPKRPCSVDSHQRPVTPSTSPRYTGGILSAVSALQQQLKDVSSIEARRGRLHLPANHAPVWNR